ncbi:PilZ domain-containing protein [Hyalangium sp.]|uniref:PilZ domain-containing protein n=1 Tax=Hyalangium sp. TaxID=2028555 RepID=UPI002D476C45|nr:PilZ domain-containing protein [Hyalangium sp.]HYH94560.1 PilZ domain-containing protein [Hyalangium sp.]
MSFDNERRRHRRYPLRLAIKLHCGGEVLDADIINASASGCLLLSQEPLEPGQLIEASIPELLIPRTRLHILRCQATRTGYVVAANFDAAMNDESPIAWLSDEQQTGPAGPRWLN